MEKTKKKTIEQTGVRKRQSDGRGGVYGIDPTPSIGLYDGKDLRKRYLLSFEWKRVGVMDNDSGDDGTDEL